jgi:hypothetical protein
MTIVYRDFVKAVNLSAIIKKWLTMICPQCLLALAFRLIYYYIHIKKEKASIFTNPCAKTNPIVFQIEGKALIKT